MDRLISLQAAIDALDRIFDQCEEIDAHLPKGDPDITGYKMYPDYMTVWKYLHQLPSVQPEPHWIPCSERLPAYGEDVLISIGGYCDVGHIVSVNEEERYNWYFSGWYHLPNDVDAWMPLPEPYKEKDNEKA